MLAFCLRRLDAHFRSRKAWQPLAPWPRPIVELLYFGAKEARACLFVGLFFACVLAVPRAGLLGVPRYDVLLLAALAIQAWMLATRLESWDEAKAIGLFHVVGFALEAFKTSPGIGSWSYPDFAYTKVLGVPLYAGFMYAAVGSYMTQAWRLFDLRVRRHPPYWLAVLTAVAVYANFFAHHWIGDHRWYIAAFAIGVYVRAAVVFRPLDRERWMPLPLAFVLIGFFIWLAENLGTFHRLWSYPDQAAAWTAVHPGKWSSWALLVMMTFTIVAHLKHIKRTIHVAE